MDRWLLGGVLGADLRSHAALEGELLRRGVGGRGDLKRHRERGADQASLKYAEVLVHKRIPDTFEI